MIDKFLPAYKQPIEQFDCSLPMSRLRIVWGWFMTNIVRHNNCWGKAAKLEDFVAGA